VGGGKEREDRKLVMLPILVAIFHSLSPQCVRILRVPEICHVQVIIVVPLRKIGRRVPMHGITLTR
jgi:hypothetical protein